MKRLHFHLTTDQTDLLLARGKSLFARLSDGTVQLWNSCWYFPLLLLVMLAALATGQPVLGVIVLGLLASWFLAFCPDLVAAITPFGMVFLLSTSEYENLGRFLPCVFLLIPLMTSLVLHLTTWPAGPDSRLRGDDPRRLRRHQLGAVHQPAVAVLHAGARRVYAGCVCPVPLTAARAPYI